MKRDAVSHICESFCQRLGLGCTRQSDGRDAAHLQRKQAAYLGRH